MTVDRTTALNWIFDIGFLLGNSTETSEKLAKDMAQLVAHIQEEFL